MFLLLALACTPPDPPAEEEVYDPLEEVEPTGVTREYEAIATYGDYDLKMDGGMSMGVVHGYHLNGQFLGPTLVADLGDTIEITLKNETNEAIGFHPHGVRYDKDNEGVGSLAPAGGEITYTWEAIEAAGTYLYHSHVLDDELIEYQGQSGVVGVIVIRDPAENALYAPDHMINYVMMNVYEGTTEIDEDAMDAHGGDDTGADTGEDHDFDPSEHLHTLVVQEVRGEAFTTDTMESLTSLANVGDSVRVNVVGFGHEFHTFHMHGYTWKDPWTDEVKDVEVIGPAISTYFHLPVLDNEGLWMVHCHVDDHFHMMSTYLLVQ